MRYSRSHCFATMANSAAARLMKRLRNHSRFIHVDIDVGLNDALDGSGMDEAEELSSCAEILDNKDTVTSLLSCCRSL